MMMTNRFSGAALALAGLGLAGCLGQAGVDESALARMFGGNAAEQLGVEPMRESGKPDG